MIRLGSDNQDISNTVTYVFYESIFGLLPSLVPLFDPENIQVLQVYVPTFDVHLELNSKRPKHMM